MMELLDDLEHAELLVDRFIESPPKDEPPEPVYPRAASGTAATEAPRGLLVHSYDFDGNGIVTSADVITPTAMNAASIEEQMRAAISRAPLAEQSELRARLEMLVRAYDPCISCSVHSVQV